ncbi:MAG: FAD:protein FMN transferase [Kiloniellaceae bacterium]
MSVTEVTRRRFIAISAAATAAAYWPGRATAGTGLLEWRGVALGARAAIRLAHPDPGSGRALLRQCVDEIERLERIFSLYRPDSALCRLNGAGTLDLPPFELVELLSYAADVSAVSQGTFDVTVQPLWQRYADHFGRPGADPAGPALADALALVDWRAVSIDANRIAFDRPGMAVTLNGIAQGYITDRVADLLRRAGMDSVLIDLGETRAVGAHPDGRPWRIGLADPSDPTRVARRLDLAEAAIATSGGYGTALDATGRHTHLIDPRSGRSAPVRQSVSVVAPRATVADAASTALALLPPERAWGILTLLGASAAHFQGPEGSQTVWA